MKYFLSKKRYAFLFFFLLSYLISLVAIYTIGVIRKSEYETEKLQTQKDLKMDSKILYNDNGVVVKQLSLADNDFGFDVNLEIENKTDKLYYLYTENVSLNGIYSESSGLFDQTVEPNSTIVVKFEARNYAIQNLGYEKLLRVQSDILFSEVPFNRRHENKGFVAEKIIDVSLPGAEKLQLPENQPNIELVFDNNDVKVSLVKEDGKVFGVDNRFYLLIENRRDEDVSLVLSSHYGEEGSVNQGELKDVIVNYVETIKANSVKYKSFMAISTLDLQGKTETGEPMTILMGTLSAESGQKISEQIYEIILK